MALQWQPDQKFTLTGKQLEILTNYIFTRVNEVVGRDEKLSYYESVGLNGASDVLNSLLEQGKLDGIVSEKDDTEDISVD